ncbi:MAG: diguanylate cyclase [Sulfuriferula sp.]
MLNNKEQPTSLLPLSEINSARERALLIELVLSLLKQKRFTYYHSYTHPRTGFMTKLPYIEPSIRSIAGGLITASGVLLYFKPELKLIWLTILFFVSLNLLQSSFTRFCLMEKILKKFGFRSEMDEIKNLNEINAGHLATLNMLSEVVVELSYDGRIVRLTESWNKLVGIETINVSSCPCLGKPFTDFVNIEDRTVLEQLLNQLKDNEINTVRFRMLREDSAEHWVEGRFTLYGSDHTKSVIRGVLRDVTESYLQEKHIAHMATHDALTNLPNRVLLEERMEQAISQAKRTEFKVAVLFIDLDNFKQVNDAHGHEAGDQLLIAISHSLKANLRTSDTLARWGGDEFVVLLQGTPQVDEIYHIAEKLMHAIKNMDDDISKLVTLSIGAAIFPDDADTSNNLLMRADKALFFAKSQGRNNIQLYSQVI